MKRYPGYIVFTLAFVFLLFFVAGPALAEMGGGMMGGGGGMGGAGGQHMGDRGKASEMMEQGMGMREERGMHGMGFMHSAGNEYGEYVTFTIDNKTGNVLNYGVMGNALFNISIADFNYRSESTSGPVTRVSNADGSILILLHDNPAAVINIRTGRDISLTFTLADGVTAAKEDNLIKIESGGVTGYIAGMGKVTGSVSGRQVTVDASPDSAVVFRAAPVNMPVSGNMHRRFSEEIARNRMGMEIALGRNRTYDSINFSSGMHMWIQAMERDRIMLLVNATEPSGRIIAINLDNTSLVIGDRERLRIHYDGQPMECADDPDIVFNGTDRPICWMSPVQKGVRAQLMMYVPGFSEHTIDILVEPEVTGTPSPAAPEGKTITLADNGQTITLQVDDRFLLKLGEDYDWTVTVDDQAIISRVVNVLVVRGAQGLYEAHKPGRAVLTATGDPVCRKARPPCGAPSRLFTLYINVVAGPTAPPTATAPQPPITKTPAFEAVFAISALLAALLVIIFRNLIASKN